jgi:hypothetical protein
MVRYHTLGRPGTPPSICTRIDLQALYFIIGSANLAGLGTYIRYVCTYIGNYYCDQREYDCKKLKKLLILVSLASKVIIALVRLLVSYSFLSHQS